MLTRVFRFFGCHSPEEIMDFVVTGAAALPPMFFLNGFDDQAAIAMLLGVLSILLAGSWTHTLRETADAEEAERRERLRHGGDDDR
jgi:hypothetical protein